MVWHNLDLAVGIVASENRRIDVAHTLNKTESLSVMSYIFFWNLTSESALLIKNEVCSASALAVATSQRQPAPGPIKACNPKKMKVFKNA